MANTIDPMDIKQIITLHIDGVSNRKIAETLGIARNTINTYIQLLTACNRPIASMLNYSDHELRELFPSKTTIDNARYDALMQFFEKVNEARNHPGFTFQYHYQEYIKETTNPYSYTQFMEHYHRKYDKIKGSMKLEHEAGKEVFIDYAGKHLYLTDRDTGELVPVEVFVAILPNSQYTYVEACMSQKREDMLTCMEHALSFYGGVPKAIVSDNLKSAVTRASKYEPTINRSFKDFARHYNCVINPTRSYAPQDKALVENAVQLAYQRIYYPIRNMTFFTLEELNKEIGPLLEEYNDMLFTRKEASRRELFQSVERQYMKALPTSSFELKDYCRAKVQKMGYVYFSPDKSYYSVPYRFIGKSTQIQYTASTVEVYYNHERIALHKRNPSKGVYITNKEHMSSSHQHYISWSPDFFRNKAAEHGPNVIDCINVLLARYEYPEVAYKSSMGIIQLHKQYGSERLDNACKRAVALNCCSYKRIKNILENNLDKEGFISAHISNNTPHIPPHDNIRGAQAYQ